MNTDHQAVSAGRVVRLTALTAFFAIVCGLPGSLDGLFVALQVLLAD